LDSVSQDAAYAIYSLKYIPCLDAVMAEVARILKPGGLFVVYDLLKTDAYDEKNAKHRSLFEQLEYACGMPSIHHRSELVELAGRNGLQLIESIDLCQETGLPFYYCFNNSALFLWLIRSALVDRLIHFGELTKVLPKGFHRFNKRFLSGTVNAIVSAGELGILSGAEIMLYKRA